MNARSSRIVGIAALLAAAAAIPSCYGYERPSDFQPVADGAKPWSPPAGWDPEPPGTTGYYVAIDSCAGCPGISYALCTGDTFTQCVCGGPFWPGVECPKSLVCCADDFPPFNWLELTKYSGPGWAGLSPGAATRTCP
jgi:hypothetical protein